MAARATPTRTPASAGAAELRLMRVMPANGAPIVAAIDELVRESGRNRDRGEACGRAECLASCSCTFGEGRPAFSEGRSSSAV